MIKLNPTERPFVPELIKKTEKLIEERGGILIEGQKENEKEHTKEKS